MPVRELKEVGKDSIVGIFEITETYQELVEALNPDSLDREMLESYSNVQKRTEWLSARILLKSLCDKLKIPYSGTRKDSNGKPFLQGHALEISLTHSYPYVAAILNPGREVGIDLEQPKEKLLKIAPRFLDERELDICQYNLEKLCVFWCAKEALYKVYSKKGLKFREEIHLYPDSGGYPWISLSGIISRDHEEKEYNLRCEYGRDYIMVYNL